jgi:alpha-amylase
MSGFVAGVVVVLVLVPLVHSASHALWANRTIYQLLTDRFARPLSNPDPFAACGDLNDYCGGTFNGVAEHLDYIAGLGFDAIWISPIVENTRGGYHGYWMKDLFAVSPEFGGQSQMQALIAAAHARNMFVMLDVVANHVGPVGNNFSSIRPFNDASYYHSCHNCPSGCSINNFACFTTEIQTCRLDNLPDLNQSDPTVFNSFLHFAQTVSLVFGFDGLRIDTSPEVDPSFWRAFVRASGLWAIGEVFTSDVACVAAYARAESGALSYPLYFTIRDVFANGAAMTALKSTIDSYSANNIDLSVLATFLGNHDNPRFMAGSSVDALKSAAVAVFFLPGVPTWYYGDEALFDNSQTSREPFWTTAFDPNNIALADWLTLVVATRKSLALSTQSFSIVHVDQDTFFFVRGTVAIVALTNQQTIPRLKRTLRTGFAPGRRLCNVFWPDVDCITIGNNGLVSIYLDNGEAKVYL